MSAFPASYNFHILPETDSTNIYAIQQLNAGLADNGYVFFTHLQLQGKGQRGKHWRATAGESILMSLILNTSRLAHSQSFRLSATIALAVNDFIQQTTGCKSFVKWPNDLYIGDRKAGGILIENQLSAGVWKWAVIGIGINVNQPEFASDLPYAVSLQMATGKHYDTVDLAKHLCGYIETRWQQLLNGGWQEILERYNQQLYGINTIKKLKKNSAVIPCLIRRVSEQGILVAGENEEWQFEHGEIEWVR